MPWFCRCHPAVRASLVAAFFPSSASSTEIEEEPEDIDTKLFQRLSQRHGVWADAQDAEEEARVQRSRSRSPTPAPHDREAWPCPQCANLNSKHVLFCTVATCGTRRHLVQKWHEGDYFCEVCGNQRFRSSAFCTWVHCHSNDWTCPRCKNFNYAARKECHTRWCKHPRDWNCPRCGLRIRVVRGTCKRCGEKKNPSESRRGPFSGRMHDRMNRIAAL